VSLPGYSANAATSSIVSRPLSIRDFAIVLVGW
jgi:hypothetical protein